MTSRLNIVTMMFPKKVLKNTKISNILHQSAQLSLTDQESVYSGID